ncbi:MAG: hypothetical protein ABI665_27430 [Vicinamibacterales bacterium]
MIPTRSRWAYAYGHLEVTIVVLSPRIPNAAALLPPGLKLGRQDLTQPGTHPVMLMFGHHSHVRQWFMPPTAGGSYDEWIVATPFLERETGDAAPWSYMSRLYLNRWWYVLLGWMYGYPKKLARTLASDDQSTYIVETFPDGKPRVSMTCQVLGPSLPFVALPRAAKLAPIFQEPFVQRLGPLPWLGSRMWFELDSAIVQPVAAHFTLADGCAPGLKAMSMDVGSILNGVPGAFHMSCDWMLSRPYLASHLPKGLRLPVPPDDERPKR